MRTPEEILDLLKSTKNNDVQKFYEAIIGVTEEEAAVIALLPQEQKDEFRALVGLPKKSTQQ